jgi:hypothetical protein
MSDAQVMHFRVLGWVRVRRSSGIVSEDFWWACKAACRRPLALVESVGMKYGVGGEELGVVDVDVDAVGE